MVGVNVCSNCIFSFLQYLHIRMMHKHFLICDMNVFHNVDNASEYFFDAYPLKEYPYSYDHLGFDARYHLYMSIYNFRVKNYHTFFPIHGPILSYPRDLYHFLTPIPDVTRIFSVFQCLTAIFSAIFIKWLPNP